MKPLLIAPLAIFTIIIIMMMGKLLYTEKTDTSPLISKPLPVFNLPAAMDGVPALNSNDIKGKYTLLNIFASWCVACKVEHEFLSRLNEKGITIYGIAWKDNQEKLTTWLKEKSNPYTAIGADATGKTIIDLGVTGAPETFLVSPEGIIIYRYAGPLSEDIWKSKFLPLMEGKK